MFQLEKEASSYHLSLHACKSKSNGTTNPSNQRDRNQSDGMSIITGDNLLTDNALKEA